MPEHLTVAGLTIVDNKGKKVATIMPADGGGGLWIEGPCDSAIAIYTIRGQAVIGFFNHYSKHDGKGMPLALTMDPKTGKTAIQFRDGNEILEITVDDLRKLKNLK